MRRSPAVGRAANGLAMDRETEYLVYEDTGVTDFEDYQPTAERGIGSRHEAVGAAAVLERETGDPHRVRPH